MWAVVLQEVFVRACGGGGSGGEGGIRRVRGDLPKSLIQLHVVGEDV